MRPELAAANAAVDEAVAIVRAGRDKPLTRIGKAAKDFLTEVDLASEAAIKRALAKSTPDIGFYGEEGGGAELHSGRVWVADPLDGTINYATGSPLCGVMLGLLEDGVPGARRDRPAVPRHARSTAARVADVDAARRGDRRPSATPSTAAGRGWTPSSTSAARSTAARCASAASARPPCSGRWLATGVIQGMFLAHNNPYDVVAGHAIARAAGARRDRLRGRAADARLDRRDGRGAGRPRRADRPRDATSPRPST